MRLINTETLELEEFVDERAVSYAILSHTWGKPQDEVSFRDLSVDPDRARTKPGYNKIVNACRLAAQDGYEYAWIDTCCLDKSSSAELSEAINSMYRWYQKSQVCYVYMADVVVNLNSLQDATRPQPNRRLKDGAHCKGGVTGTTSSADNSKQRVSSAMHDFERSRWFTRGWTLQELLAPPKVQFYSASWAEIGSLEDLSSRICLITGIPLPVIEHAVAAQNLSIAARMSWASRRTTSRIEDRAYSLLGLFGVHMPLLYGEGEHAFVRLEEEIIKSSTDQSIFVWEIPTDIHEDLAETLIAPSPECFRNGGNIEQAPIQGSGGALDYTLTNGGLQTSMPIIERASYKIGILNCAKSAHERLAIRLARDIFDPRLHHVADGPQLQVISRVVEVDIETVEREGLSCPMTVMRQGRRLYEEGMSMKLDFRDLKAGYECVELYPPQQWLSWFEHKDMPAVFHPEGISDGRIAGITLRINQVIIYVVVDFRYPSPHFVSEVGGRRDPDHLRQFCSRVEALHSATMYKSVYAGVPSSELHVELQPPDAIDPKYMRLVFGSHLHRPIKRREQVMPLQVAIVNRMTRPHFAEQHVQYSNPELAMTFWHPDSEVMAYQSSETEYEEGEAYSPDGIVELE